MKVLLRADASVTLGSGHIMRCLTLARALIKQGAVCDFICQPGAGNLMQWLSNQGLNVIALPEGIKSELEDAQYTLARITEHYQLLVLDHYQLGQVFCKALRARCDSILVIDDLANRQHDCDILLDQNLVPDANRRYANLLPLHCKQLLGPRYALLRDEFYHVTKQPKHQHILVGFGGSDEYNLTTLALNAIKKLKPQTVTADIVVGVNNPWLETLQQQVANQPNLHLHVQASNMAMLMKRASIMLGSGGTTHWERCICGLPGLIITVAKNQHATTKYLDQLGACVWLGEAADMSAEILAEQLHNYLFQPTLLEKIAQAAIGIVPANAGTPLVVEQILNVVAE